MRALLYVALFFLVLWAGVSIENARMPAPAKEEAAGVSEPELLPEVPAAGEETIAEEEQEETEPGPLIGAQDPPVPPAPSVVYDEEYVEALEQAIHERINVERVRAGLKILAYDEELAVVAASHSTDMAKENYFAHEDENDCNSACRLDNAEYRWRWVGENLFLLRSSYRYSVDDAAAVIVAGWMGSAGHRKNVLNRNFTHEGLGVVVSGNSLYATELFSQPR